MHYDKLDNEELLFVALDAINGRRHGEAIALLKDLLDREPDHDEAKYLIAAQHAQIGMGERAESELRSLLDEKPGFVLARFQLGQLLLMRGSMADVVEILAPLRDGVDPVAAYARGLSSYAQGQPEAAVRHMEEGLALPQPLPAIADDMRAFHTYLLQLVKGASVPDVAASEQITPASRMRIAGYGLGE
ncbi:tetratricopeptide repeat protein [Arenimonas terrae]|uniref:Tetratricopeptide repeat protein n=1 Tax=Arenimonas terrae TaxID=2546226 RepID=A0A5C4RPZ7_9GAMM|nr:tetratricopeptide repeat protein [Arenimonas terrae]TNJ33222.1 hypothetical protein E1B00_13060 [Arenimonas terrae]